MKFVISHRKKEEGRKKEEDLNPDYLTGEIFKLEIIPSSTQIQEIKMRTFQLVL